jgi:hypothetical protein
MEELGLETDFDSGLTVETTFYHIDCINPDTDGEKTYGTAIVSGGQFFSCPLPVEEVDRRIMEAMHPLTMMVDQIPNLGPDWKDQLSAKLGLIPKAD